VIKAIADVGLEQVTAGEEKRRNVLGSMAPQTSLLSPKAQANLAKIYNYAGAEPPAMATPSTSGYTTTAVQGGGQVQPAQTQLPYLGRSATQADLEHTARSRGMSVQDVKNQWVSKGGKVVN
jgi:hypothetical protein